MVVVDHVDHGHGHLRAHLLDHLERVYGHRVDGKLSLAQRAESLGFGAFFRSDHYLKMGGVSGLPGPSRALSL